MPRQIDKHSALIFTMMLISAAEGDGGRRIQYHRPDRAGPADFPRLRLRAIAGRVASVQ